MSGAEVGLILGVLPLLVSAIEHFDVILGPLQRFKDYAPELSRFQRRLMAQKTIFRSQCQLLLVPLTCHETANQMLEDPKHEKWSEDLLKNELEQQLLGSAEACVEIIRAIEDELSTIQKQAEDFGLWQPTGIITKKAWRTRLKGKLKFSFSQSRIEDSLQQVRDLNQDFTALSDQTLKLLHPKISDSKSISSLQAIKHCQRIQEASLHLVEALQLACYLHEEHQAHLQVERPVCGQHEELQENSDVLFCLGLSRKAEDPTKSNKTMWLVVRSIFQSVPNQNPASTERRQVMEVLSQLGTSLMRVMGPPLPPLQPRPGPNFCTLHNLCTHISLISRGQGTENSSNACFGHLERSPVIHELYFESQRKATESSCSLQDWVKNIGERDRTEQVPVLECLRLARHLAMFVLQFHTTPLLTESWDGKDIEFFGLRPNRAAWADADQEKIPQPFLKVKVSLNCTQSTAVSEIGSVAENTIRIRNRYLFRLGIIFLELAYQVPFSSLGNRPKLRPETEYDKADQYSRLVGSILGPRYAKIVRKCLGCDFGQDVDLGSHELGAAVYRHVVVELDELVHDFEKKMDITE